VEVTPSGPLKANSGVRSGVAAAGKVLEGDDQLDLRALYYDFRFIPIFEFPIQKLRNRPTTLLHAFKIKVPIISRDLIHFRLNFAVIS